MTQYLGGALDWVVYGAATGWPSYSYRAFNVMTPHGGPLDEKYFRDVTKGCGYIFLFTGIIIMIAYLFFG